MKNEFTFYENYLLNLKIGSVEIDGKVWLVGTDIAEALGYTDAEFALASYVEPEDIVDYELKGKDQSLVLDMINEAGFNRLLEVIQEEIELIINSMQLKCDGRLSETLLQEINEEIAYLDALQLWLEEDVFNYREKAIKDVYDILTDNFISDDDTETPEGCVNYKTVVLDLSSLDAFLNSLNKINNR